MFARFFGYHRWSVPAHDEGDQGQFFLRERDRAGWQRLAPQRL
ncbi:MAG: hypothetical protein ACI89X_002547 [Planctomycetota bacterium]|jgi:hypothetical protein